jgi:hypothetical protein
MMLRSVSVLMILSACVRAAEPDTLRSAGEFHPVDGWTSQKIVSTAVVGGVLVGSLVDSYFAWWDDSDKPFTFHTDHWLAGDQLGIDKVGHFYTSYFYFHTFRNIMLWGGYDEDASTYWALGTSAFFALSIEIGDGVSEYGFDYQDLVFNMAGLGYGFLQTRIPLLQEFNFKWSYVPEGGYQWPPRFTEHYDAHTYWLAVDINDLMPESWASYWPDFLQPAVGYSVGSNVTKSEFVVGLDFNLDVFDPPGRGMNLLLKTVNMYHFPAPAVKFTEGEEQAQWFLFYLR